VKLETGNVSKVAPIDKLSVVFVETYEHIIRNEQAYQNISNYIIRNPEKWQDDKCCF
jgi:uncharacterized membrane protein